MAKKDVSPPQGGKTAKLRVMAEDLLKTQGASVENNALAAEDVRALTHELHVHQIELELQNEELKQFQDELQSAYNKLSDLYDFAPVGYFTLDSKGAVLEANLSGCTMVGMERSKVIGRPFTRFVAPESLDPFYLYRRNALSSTTRESMITSMVKAGGGAFVANLESVAVADPVLKTTVLRLTVSDITPIVEAERALRKSEERYRVLINNIPAVTWTRNNQGTITFISPNVKAVCGFSAEEVIGTDMRFWKKQVHPEDAPLVIHSFIKMLSEGEASDVEHRFRHKNGEWMWLMSRALSRKEEGNTVRVDGMFIDITDRKRAEEQAREAQRRQALLEKQAALGEVAAAVSHEINNPLAGIENGFHLLKKAIPPDHPNFKFAEMVGKEIRRLSDMLRQMSLLYSPPSTRRNECDAVRGVKDTLQILSSECRSQGLNFRVNDDVPELPVRMGDGELRQVIYNIVINAMQASPRGKEVHILLERGDKWGRISVTDQGDGIPDDVRPRIFEPFYSNRKGNGQSSMGLGLSVSRSLVEEAGGHIDVKTQAGKGSTFTVVLPAV